MADFPRPNLPTPSDASPHCRNCGAVAQDKFCPSCGQATRNRQRSLWYLISDFSSNFFATDSRALRSLGLLILKPGALTQENLRGRWNRYVPPLRLYLFLSLICFLIFRSPLVPDTNLNGDDLDTQPELSISGVDDSSEANRPKFQRPIYAAITGGLETKPFPGEDEEPRVDVVSDESAFREFGTAIENRFYARLAEFQGKTYRQILEVLIAEFLNALPTFLILTIPLFGVALKLLYLGSGRLLFEHLIFALHFYSMAFVAITVSAVSHTPVVKAGVAFIYIPAYLWLALRRVYQGSKFFTTLKLGLIIILQLFICLCIIGLVLMYSLLFA
ncbi:MAG: DUF3667 domain-containing protein [Planctomycetes bacterium]|nr:DUF3667 domain-containing protein [Planctomycetota bacterium]